MSGRILVVDDQKNMRATTGLILRQGDRITGTLSIATDGERILAVYAVVNPDKLH